MGSLLMGFLLLLGASCTEDMSAEQQTAGGAASGDLVPVEFTVGDVANLTRAASSIVTFNANEQVKVCVKPNGQSSYTGYNYTTQNAGNSDIVLTAPDTPPYFPVGSAATVEAYAYYPASAGTSFSVQADQTTDANYKASGLMYAANRTITKGVSDGSNSLLMNHLMAQLHLNVTGQGVSINRVLVNCKRSVTFTPEAQTVVSTTGSADDIVAMTGSGDTYVCIPQQPINTVTVKVETGSANDASTTATFAFTATSDFLAGKCYPLNLSVSVTQVGTTTSIENWDGMQAVNIEGAGGLDVHEVSESYTYDGSAKTPTPDVYSGTTKLTKDTDYELVYINNINAGKASVCAIGKNSYAGKVGVRVFVIMPPGGLNGWFTVDESGKQVMFSKGNLQATYNGSSWTWAFAEHQWDCIGNAEGNTKVSSSSPFVYGYSGSSTTVDLFGWVGASSTWTGVNKYGITSSVDRDSYNRLIGYGNKNNDNLNDWGTLPITNGGNTANSGWFTLSSDEWGYLFNTRTASTVGGTANGRYAKATVNGVNGMILFPDSYTHPDGLTAPASVNSSSADYTANIYDATDWGKMETAGAVFLPAAGCRLGLTFYSVALSGCYLSSTPDASEARFMYRVDFNSSSINLQFNDARYAGYSVRLVRPVE